MRHRHIFIPIICIVLLCGCSSNKPTGSIGRLEHRAIDLGNQYLGYGGFIAYCNGDIVGIEMNPSASPFFCLDSKEQSFYLFGNRGRGPGEFLMPYSIQFTDNQSIGISDAQTRIYYEFAIPEEGETPKIHKELKLQLPASRIIKTAFDQYISLFSSLDGKMFALIDSTGVQIDTFLNTRVGMLPSATIRHGRWRIKAHCRQTVREQNSSTHLSGERLSIFIRSPRTKSS